MNALDLLIKIIADASGMSKGFGDAEKEVKTFGDKMNQTMTQLGGAMLQFFGAAAIAEGIRQTIVEADALQTQLDTMAIKINNLQPAAQVSAESIYELTGALAQGTKFIDDEVREALDRAIVKTRDYGAAVQVTKDAVNLATLANIPLAQAADALALAYEGNTRGLGFLARQLGLNIKDGETYASIIEKINNQSKGLGETMENSVSVQLKKLKDSFSDVFIDITRYSGILNWLVQALKDVGAIVHGLASTFQLLGATIGGVIYMASEQLGALLKYLTGGWMQGGAGLTAMKNQIDASTANFKAQMVSAWEDVAKTWETIEAKIPKAGHGPKTQAQDFSDEDKAEYSAFWKKQDAIRQARYKKMETEHKKHLAMKNEWDQWYYEEMEKLDKETWAEVEADAEKYTAAINEALGNIITEGIDSLIDSLFEGGQSFGEWAQNAVQAIEKVILKMMLLKALEAALNSISGGLGTAFSGFMGGGSSPVSAPGTIQPVVNIQLVTADPTSYVRFHNSAISRANPGAQERYSRGAISGLKK